MNNCKKCRHTKALLNTNEGYCPDCGEYLKKYYKMVADIPEYQIDVENYMLYGRSDSLYYSRVPRQLERTINFKDIRMELPTSYRVQGSKEQKEQFTYTMFSLFTLQNQDIQYERLLAVDRSLVEEPFLDKEREAFVQLKYYYIFKLKIH